MYLLHYELEPCPFCGCKAEDGAYMAGRDRNDDVICIYIKCTNRDCNTKIETIYSGNRNYLMGFEKERLKLIRKWNRRNGRNEEVVEIDSIKSIIEVVDEIITYTTNIIGEQNAYDLRRKLYSKNEEEENRG